MPPPFLSRFGYGSTSGTGAPASGGRFGFLQQILENAAPGPMQPVPQMQGRGLMHVLPQLGVNINNLVTSMGNIQQTKLDRERDEAEKKRIGEATELLRTQTENAKIEGEANKFALTIARGKAAENWKSTFERLTPEKRNELARAGLTFEGLSKAIDSNDADTIRRYTDALPSATEAELQEKSQAIANDPGLAKIRKSFGIKDGDLEGARRFVQNFDVREQALRLQKADLEETELKARIANWNAQQGLMREERVNTGLAIVDKAMDNLTKSEAALEAARQQNAELDAFLASPKAKEAIDKGDFEGLGLAGSVVGLTKFKPIDLKPLEEDVERNKDYLAVMQSRLSRLDPNMKFGKPADSGKTGDGKTVPTTTRDPRLSRMFGLPEVDPGAPEAPGAKPKGAFTKGMPFMGLALSGLANSPFFGSAADEFLRQWELMKDMIYDDPVYDGLRRDVMNGSKDADPAFRRLMAKIRATAEGQGHQLSGDEIRDIAVAQLWMAKTGRSEDLPDNVRPQATRRY